MRNFKKDEIVKINYSIMIAIVLLLVSIDQVDASWKKNLAGASMAAGSAALAGYYDDQQQEKNSPRQVPSNSKYSKSNQTIQKPIGVDGLREATAKLDKFMADLIEEESTIEGLRFSQLTSQGQVIAYLQDSFKRDMLADDFNFPLIAHFVFGFSDKEYDTFIRKIREYAHKDNSRTITMHYVDKAFVYINIDKINRIMGRRILDEFGEDIFIKMLRMNQIELEELHNSDSRLKLSLAYHEAAHALMCILRPIGLNVSQLSLKPKGLVAGANITKPQFIPPTQTSVYNISQTVDAKLENTKNNIMQLLAGGIGEEILDGKKLSLKDFIVEYSETGMGDRFSEGTDIFNVYAAAEYYCNFKNCNYVSEYQEELEPYLLPNQEELEIEMTALIEECYNEAYQILSMNRVILDKIVKRTLQEGFTSGEKLYEIAGVKRPKYEFEMNSEEKIAKNIADLISWTHKRITFYERNSPQF